MGLTRARCKIKINTVSHVGECGFVLETLVLPSQPQEEGGLKGWTGRVGERWSGSGWVGTPGRGFARFLWRLQLPSQELSNVLLVCRPWKHFLEDRLHFCIYKQDPTRPSLFHLCFFGFRFSFGCHTFLCDWSPERYHGCSFLEKEILFGPTLKIVKKS